MPEASHVYREMQTHTTTSERSNVIGFLVEKASKTFDSAGVVFFYYCYLQTCDSSGVIQINGLFFWYYFFKPEVHCCL